MRSTHGWASRLKELGERTIVSDGPQRIAKPSKETSFEWSSALVACVALVVSGLAIWAYQPGGEDERGLSGSDPALQHRRVDFDMYPGEYAVTTEAVGFDMAKDTFSIDEIMGQAFIRNAQGRHVICLSPENANYNIFTEGFATNCVLEENRSFPGTIDVIQSCSIPVPDMGPLTVRLQGNVTTDAADVIMAAQFDFQGAGSIKTIMKGTMRRLGDCAS